MLILVQVNVNCRTKDGSTALHYGAAFGQTHVLAPLVAAGCPVDSRDNALNTPLHLAAGARQHKQPGGEAEQPGRAVLRCSVGAA